MRDSSIVGADGFVNGILHCCLLCCSLEHPFPLSLRASLPLSHCFVFLFQSVKYSFNLFLFLFFSQKILSKKRENTSSVDSFSRFCPLFHFGPAFGYCF